MLLRMYVLTNVKIKVIWAMAIGKSFFLHSTQVSVRARALKHRRFERCLPGQTENERALALICLK